MLPDYHEVDPSAMATQQQSFLKHEAKEAKEIDLYGMTLAAFEALTSTEYEQHLARTQTFDL
tara:strand:+ start:5309 stop:5494 length:186 start_codon:yes stop_codon:yes gene_type:complete